MQLNFDATFLLKTFLHHAPSIALKHKRFVQCTGVKIIKWTRRCLFWKQASYMIKMVRFRGFEQHYFYAYTPCMLLRSLFFTPLKKIFGRFHDFSWELRTIPWPWNDKSRESIVTCCHLPSITLSSLQWPCLLWCTSRQRFICSSMKFGLNLRKETTILTSRL